MRSAHVILAAIFLIACSSSKDEGNLADPSAPGRCNGQLAIPWVSPSASYQHWHLLVGKLGNKRWNGQDIDTATAQKYMDELSRMSPAAGYLVFHLEPGISCEELANVNQMIIKSSLCSNNRCFQDEWEYNKPIVN